MGFVAMPQLAFACYFNSKLKNWRYFGVENCLRPVVASQQSCPGQFANLTHVLVNYKMDLGE
jgi:hypothetical protein